MTFILYTDQSDEEEVPLQKDESWNPKIKMSNLGPKMDRPVNNPFLKLDSNVIHSKNQVRDSAKNVAIEKGLSHAAHKSGSFLKLKTSSSNIQKKARPTQPTQSSSTSSSFKLDLEFSKDRHRPKKVGNTAKQRLGKILGLKF